MSFAEFMTTDAPHLFIGAIIGSVLAFGCYFIGGLMNYYHDHNPKYNWFEWYGLDYDDIIDKARNHFAGEPFKSIVESAIRDARIIISDKPGNKNQLGIVFVGDFHLGSDTHFPTIVITRNREKGTYIIDHYDWTTFDW